MNTVQGTISNIQRQPVAGGTRITFRLRSADGRETPVETRLDIPYSNGDFIAVKGEVNSELVLIAVEISPGQKTQSNSGNGHFPWLWVVIAACVLVVIVLWIALKSSTTSGPGTKPPIGKTTQTKIIPIRPKPLQAKPVR